MEIVWIPKNGGLIVIMEMQQKNNLLRHQEKHHKRDTFGKCQMRKHHGNKTLELLTRENTSRIEPLILMPYQQLVSDIPS
jgi:hypothetical protein